MPRSHTVLNSAVAYSSDSTPRVLSVSPARGSTAGGTLVTIMVDGSGAPPGTVVVSLAGIPCNVTAVEWAAVGGRVMCVTGAHGPTGAQQSGVGPLRLVVEGSGAAVVNESVHFEYVDLWSARTTWGGGPPPLLGDSVWITVGQKVLLDVSPPRLYMIVVQGHLLFDRKDVRRPCVALTHCNHPAPPRGRCNHQSIINQTTALSHSQPYLGRSPGSRFYCLRPE